MSIHLKVARTHKEIDDALWVRHEVIVIEDGKFGGQPLPDERLIDRFDVFPGVDNIVAYDGDEAIATIRLAKENVFGLPADQLFDFTDYREAAQRELVEQQRARKMYFNDPAVVLGSAGMLAIRRGWRGRRDVIRAMFKMAAGVCYVSGVTHIVVTVNHETASMYRRLGFTPLAKKIWIEEIGNHIIPLASSTQSFYDWAFGDLPPSPLNIFQDSFQRVFLRQGETVFSEGDAGGSAYIIDSGTVRISRQTPDGSELTLTHLERGDLFGELALIDAKPRSASAVAMTDVELITLERSAFMDGLAHKPQHIQQILEIFTARIRRMDELALVLAYAPVGKRLTFALELLRERAIPDRKRAGHRVSKGGPMELALSAAVDEETAKRFLEERRERGELKYSSKQISFLN